MPNFLLKIKTPVDSLAKVISTTLSVFGPNGMTTFAVPPDVLEYPFTTVEGGVGDTGSCFIVDSNAAGPGGRSNEAIFDISPVPIDPSTVPPVAREISVERLPNGPPVVFGKGARPSGRHFSPK